MSKVATMNTRDKILRASALLFHEKGYTGTSMREIAQAVGIEAPSLYNHISGKEQLLSEICFNVSQAFTAQIQEVRCAAVSPIEKLESIFRFHIQMAFEDYTAVTAFNDEWRHLSSNDKGRFVGERKVYEQVIQDILKEGQAACLIQEDIDVGLATKSLLSSLRWMYFSRLKERKMDEDKIFAQWRQLIMKGLVN